MKRLYEIIDKSKMTLDELGQKVNCPKETARKSAWQFLRQTNDPRLPMLRKFAKAVRVSLRDLVSWVKSGSGNHTHQRRLINKCRTVSLFRLY
jgi:transcriptional regulator with XRE-family HTH domain